MKSISDKSKNGGSQIIVSGKYSIQILSIEEVERERIQVYSYVVGVDAPAKEKANK